MVRVLRHVVWSTAVAGSVAVAAFGSACAKSNSEEVGQGVCATSGDCPNDGALSQSAIDACNTQISGACGSAYSNYFTCVKSNATCSTAGVSQAPPASTCAAENSALDACLAGGGTDGGTSGGDSGGTTPDSGGSSFDSGSSGGDTGTTTGSCPGDEFSFGEAACQTCADSMCCASVTACSGDSNCGSLVTCIGQCAQNDQTCANACGMQYPSAVSEYNALGMCLESDCATACGG
jgi:hypothetical protein